MFALILASSVLTRCSEGGIRLVNGPDNFEGSVEVCHNNEWGTVCDNSWSVNDGIVACRQLGLSYVSVVTNAYYGQGEGQIWLQHLSCTGSERRLIDCNHDGFGVHNCSHHEDAGLVCNSKYSYQFYQFNGIMYKFISLHTVYIPMVTCFVHSLIH